MSKMCLLFLPCLLGAAGVCCSFPRALIQLLNIRSGFPFVFLLGSKAGGWKGGQGFTHVHHNWEHQAAWVETQGLPIQKQPQHPI